MLVLFPFCCFFQIHLLDSVPDQCYQLFRCSGFQKNVNKTLALILLKSLGLYRYYLINGVIDNFWAIGYHFFCLTICLHTCACAYTQDNEIWQCDTWFWARQWPHSTLNWSCCVGSWLAKYLNTFLDRNLDGSWLAKYLYN